MHWWCSFQYCVRVCVCACVCAEQNRTIGSLFRSSIVLYSLEDGIKYRYICSDRGIARLLLVMRTDKAWVVSSTIARLTSGIYFIPHLETVHRRGSIFVTGNYPDMKIHQRALTEKQVSSQSSPGFNALNAWVSSS